MQPQLIHSEIRSFIDLRRFALERVKPYAQTGAKELDDPFLGGRRLLDLPPGAVEVGAFSPLGSDGFCDDFPADEFLFVCEGQLTLEVPGKETVTLGVGQAAVVQHGSQFNWACHGRPVVASVRYLRSTVGSRLIAPISDSPVMQPSRSPSADLLTTASPTCRSYCDYASADGKFTCGTWDSTPYTRRAMFYPHYELMCLSKGSVTFCDECGRKGTFSRGDLVLLEQHSNCSWESTEDVAKIYAVYRP